MKPTMQEIAAWLREAARFLHKLGMAEEREKFESRATLVEAMGPTSAEWKSALDPVMPPDFKDWHQNNINDLPEVAALVIQNLRERLAEYEAMGEREQPLFTIEINKSYGIVLLFNKDHTLKPGEMFDCFESKEGGG